MILTTLGVGGTTDALFAGMAIPQLVLSIVSGALVQVLTPILSGEREDLLREPAWGAFLMIGAVMGGWLLPFTSRRPCAWDGCCRGSGPGISASRSR